MSLIRGSFELAASAALGTRMQLRRPVDGDPACTFTDARRASGRRSGERRLLGRHDPSRHPLLSPCRSPRRPTHPPRAGSTGAQLSLAPLVAAIIEDLVDRGRRLAAHSTGGRLDSPLLLVLDEAANIAPLPTLPSPLADGGGVGIPTVAVFQSLAQARARWGDAATDAMWAASTIKIHPRRARQNLRPRGNLPLNRRLRRRTVHNNTRRPPTRSSSTVRKTPALSPQALRRLGPGEAVMLPRNAPPVRTLLRPTLVAARGTADT